MTTITIEKEDQVFEIKSIEYSVSRGMWYVRIDHTVTSFNDDPYDSINKTIIKVSKHMLLTEAMNDAATKVLAELK